MRVRAHPVIRVIAGSLKCTEVVSFGSARGYLNGITFSDGPSIVPPADSKPYWSKQTCFFFLHKIFLDKISETTMLPHSWSFSRCDTRLSRYFVKVSSFYVMIFYIIMWSYYVYFISFKFFCDSFHVIKWNYLKISKKVLCSYVIMFPSFHDDESKLNQATQAKAMCLIYTILLDFIWNLVWDMVGPWMQTSPAPGLWSWPRSSCRPVLAAPE